MRCLFLIFLCLAFTGCGRDAKLHNQVAGTWGKFGDSSKMTLDSDGSFHTRFSLVESNNTKEWAQDGTWDVKDGFLIFTVTNSTARNAPIAVSIGQIDRCKIIFIDAHNMVYRSSDDKDGFSWIR
jgi:hypothetical protein